MNLDILICVHSQSEFHDKLLRRALQSLVDQTYQDFNVVIVLDSCHNETKNVIAEFNSKLRITDVEHTKISLAYAKNYGLKYCFGDWITYLDGDDSLEPTKLEEQFDFIAKNPQYDIVGTLAWDVYNVGTDQEYKTPSCFAEGQYDEDWKIRARLPIENVFTHGSLALKKSLLDKIGGYSENKKFLGKEDWHLLYNSMFYFNAKAFIIPKRLYNYSMGTSVER